MFNRSFFTTRAAGGAIALLLLIVVNFVGNRTSANAESFTTEMPIVGAPLNYDDKGGKPDTSNLTLNLPVGTVGSTYWYRLTPYIPNVTEGCIAVTNGNYAQLSFNPTVGFSSMLINVPFSSDSSGNMGLGRTPLIYVKAIAPINNLMIALSCPETVNEPAYINVLPAPDPSPTPTPVPPPNEPNAAIRIDSVGTVGVGEFVLGRIEILHGLRNTTGTATISTGTGTTPANLGLAKQPFQTPSNSITLQIPIDSHGYGMSGDFIIYGQEAKPTAHTLNAYIQYGHGSGHYSKSLNVVNITQLAVSRDANQVQLDENPNVGGGLRIFPEKKSPTDESNGRKRVNLKAKLSRPISGVQIDFKLFDVDDPFGEIYTSVDPTRLEDIDPNGDLGGDNRDKLSMFTGIFTAVTDTSGEATISVKVPLQPGDNMRAVATARPNPQSGNSWFMNFVKVDDTNLEFSGNIVPEIGTTVSNGVSTPMVTTWRSLHIERDSLGIVSGNSLSRQIQSKANLSNGNTQLTITGTGLTAKTLEDGRISLPVVGTANSFDIVTNDRFTIEVKGQTVPSSAVGRVGTIYDDDDVDRNDNILIGDNGDDVPMPDIGFLQDSDIPIKNMLAIAYIRPKYDLGTGSYDDDLPFVPNAPKAVATREFPTDEEAMSMMEFDNVSLRRNEEYWTVYLFGAYQAALNQDLDPITDSADAGLQGYLGYANPKVGALCFIENASDQAQHGIWSSTDRGFSPKYDARDLPLHEIAHLLRVTHDDGGLMSVDLTNQPYIFTGKALNKMRSSKVPWMGDY